MRELTAEEQYRDEIKELQDRLNSERSQRTREHNAIAEKLFATERELDRTRSRLHSAEMAIRWMNRYNRAGPDALEWIKAAGIELAKDEVVEKHEPITFDGNVADVPRYPTGPKVRGPE